MEFEKKDEPFAHIIFKDLLSSVALHEIKEIIESQPFERKSADLFDLEQTTDLSDEQSLSGLREKMLSLKEIIKNELGIDVTSLDMSAMHYQECDYLLCHDDQLEGRKIAYILYLAKPEQGGELLFRSSTEPYDVQVTIPPLENTLVLFEVSNKSLHEVSEIIKGERLSIGGWFH